MRPAERRETEKSKNIKKREKKKKDDRVFAHCLFPSLISGVLSCVCCRHGRLPSALEKAQSVLVQCSLIGLQELISQPRLSQDVCSVRSSLSPFELLLQAAQETEAFVFHKECDFIFLYS